MVSKTKQRKSEVSDVSSYKHIGLDDYVNDLVFRIGSVLKSPEETLQSAYIGDDTSPAMKPGTVYTHNGIEVMLVHPNIVTNVGEPLFSPINLPDGSWRYDPRVGVLSTDTGEYVVPARDVGKLHFGLSEKGKAKMFFYNIAEAVVAAHGVWRDVPTGKRMNRLPVKIKSPMIEDVYRKYINVDPNDIEKWGAVSDEITMIVYDFIMEVKSFISDDHWKMHFAKLKFDSVVVEKGPDFRIWDWERRMLSGEWK